MRSTTQRYLWRGCLLSILMLGLLAIGAEAQTIGENVDPSLSACSETGVGSTATSNICAGASVRLVGITGQCSELTEEEKESQSCADVTFDEAIDNANDDCAAGCKCNNLRVNGPDVDCFQAADTCYCTCSKSVSGSCTSASVSTTYVDLELPSFIIPQAPLMCTLAQVDGADEQQVL